MRTVKKLNKPAKLPTRQEGYLYCRVSDKSQIARGHGLESQEAIGRELFDKMRIKVLAVFRDDFTGKTLDRPDLNRLLDTLKKQKYRTFVFVDDISRLARDLYSHLSLRYAITAMGGIVVDPKHGVFSDDPEEDPREVINAWSASNQRKTNAEQSTRRMRGRCLDGHWCLQLPTGYKYRLKEKRDDKSVILRDEPVATTVQKALESFASGHLTTQADVARFLTADPVFPKQQNGRVSDEMARNGC